MESNSSDILTVDEAADLLKIPRSSVYKLAQEGKIPATKIGKHWRFHRPTLVGFISGHPTTTLLMDEKKTNTGPLSFS